MRRAKVRFNYNDYLLLPEDKRYEILDGDVFVVAAPNIRHQRICGNLFDALRHHVRERDLGELLFAPCDVILSEEDILQPDILFVRKERRDIIGETNIRGAPDLLVEILSEGSHSRDLDLKRKIYARFGVQDYWIADPDSASVEVLTWSEAGYVTSGSYAQSDFLASPLLPDMRIPPSVIFAAF